MKKFEYSENKKFKGEFEDGEKFEAWFSRSMAIVVLVQDDISGEFVIEKRGPGCPDNIGKYVFPCGYVGWGETVQEAAAREVYEETGIHIDSSSLILFGVESEPTANRQNITLRFYTRAKHDDIMKGLQNHADSSERGGEKDECSEIKTMGLYEIAASQDKFAFGHSEIASKFKEAGPTLCKIIDTAMKKLD